MLPLYERCDTAQREAKRQAVRRGGLFHAFAVFKRNMRVIGCYGDAWKP